MNRQAAIATLLIVPGLYVLLLATAVTAHADSSSPPNLVLILADDLGYSDLSCYGNSLVQTPHLDGLAKSGLRFTQAYAPAPICSASRAAILTGKSPARLGFEFVTKNEPGHQPMNERLQTPAYTLNLPRDERTIAEILADVGYRTAFFGKWHLNQHHQRYLGWSPTHGPQQQGFDVAEEDFGSHPYSYWSDPQQRQLTDFPPESFPVDSMTGRAEQFLRADHTQPFFLMVSHFYVHTPVHTRLRWLFDQCLNRIPPEHPRREPLARYLAMVITLDHYVGQLLQTLQDTGLDQNTLVVFTSDNGGHPEFAGNAPLRGSKWNLYEGGIRVPLLIRWPGVTPAGSVCETPVSGTDLLPTLAAVAHTPVTGPLDGRSLLPLLQDPDSGFEQRELLWHFPYYHPESGFRKAGPAIGIDDGFTSQTRPQSALRSGDWKLLHFFEDDRDELYNLATDSSEQNELRQLHPDVARRLRSRLDTLLQERQARLPVIRDF